MANLRRAGSFDYVSSKLQAIRPSGSNNHVHDLSNQTLPRVHGGRILARKRYVLHLPTASYPATPPESELIETLKTKPAAEKAIACKQLAICGTKECVPELAKLLSDKELSSWSRIALEAIPDQSADEALVEAAGKLHGRLLVGTINSIGVRKTAAATEVLTGHLEGQRSSKSRLRRPSRWGKSATMLRPKRFALRSKTAPPRVRSAVAEGCILCAERLNKEGKTDEAAAIYEEVRKADVPQAAKARSNPWIHCCEAARPEFRRLSSSFIRRTKLFSKLA